MSDVRIFFVLCEKYKDENEADDVMVQAFEICKQYVERVSWVKESSMGSLKLQKTDVVVFEAFTGKTFENMKQTRSTRILGPLVLSICLTEGKEIPKYPWPIYNVAMYNLIVACSHLPRKTKTQIKEKVELMGGCCTDTLVDKNTHLVTGSTKSEKYFIAAEKGLKLMLPAWVDSVWNDSQNCNVTADDEKYDVYRCLPFHNLTICSTGITSQSKRNELTEIVRNNGGTMTGKLNLAITDVLICYGEASCDSEKFKAARKFPEISCVTIDWLYDSVTKGYALKPDLYQIKKPTSTPSKENNHINPNFSNISAITVQSVSNIDETSTAGTSKFSFDVRQQGTKRKCSSLDDNNELIEQIDIKKVKRAGHFLDGCSVYLTGFDIEHRDKLIKVLNFCGATRYDDISDRVTHVIVGDMNCPEVKIIKNKSYDCSLVKLQWLLDSIDVERPVCEDEYLIETLKKPAVEMGGNKSPLCKKGLNLLKTNKTITENELEVQNKLSQNAMRDEEDIMKIYSQPQSSTQDTLAGILKNVQPEKQASPSQISNCSNNSTTKSIFGCKKFILVGFNEEQGTSLKEQIEDEAGEVVSRNFKGISDYVVAPVFPESEISQTAQEIVNDLWISECLNEGTNVDVEYYHRPFVLPDSKPLKNCVVTISSYSGYERVFLKSLITRLGAVSQEQFARITSEEKGIFASTHLVSPEASGKKYQAALKWKLPIISKEWLLDCAKFGKYVSEKNYIVGDSVVPEKLDDTVNDLNITPVAKKTNNSVIEKTPINNKSSSISKIEDISSQVTPVNKIIEEARKNALIDSPETPKKYYPWDPKTPETPEAGIASKWTPGTRKAVEVFINNIPEFKQPKKRLSTPLSVIRERLRNKIGNYEDSKDDEPKNDNLQPKVNNKEDSTQNLLINDKLQQLENMLSSSSGARRSSRTFQSTVPAPAPEPEPKHSQVFTVGWDFTEPETEAKSPERSRIFMISGVEAEPRRRMASQIESLGGIASDSGTYDPSATHLLCSRPGRNEKVLSCMAGGKWILHASYIEDSVEAGEFLEEEEYEFGNPKFKIKDKDLHQRLDSMHWWRKEITRRGYGAFNDMRAIVVANKRGPIIRVIEAGGGIVIDVSPPFDSTVHATHCLIDAKTLTDPKPYYPLARQGVFCVNTLYISEFLHRTAKDARDCVLPAFARFYA